MLKQKNSNTSQITVYWFFRTNLTATTHFHLLSLQFNTVICNYIKLSDNQRIPKLAGQALSDQLERKHDLNNEIPCKRIFLGLVNHYITSIKLNQDFLEEIVTQSSSRYLKKHLSLSLAKDFFSLLTKNSCLL